MALHFARTQISKFARPAGLFATLSLGLIAGGCAQVGIPDLPGALAANSTQSTQDAPTDGRSELQVATAYWGKKFKEHPRNLDNALNYAMNLKALGHKRQALAVLQRAGLFHRDSRRLASEYGRIALDLGQLEIAKKVLAMADDPANPDWRVISALGTVLAKEGKYGQAIPYYERALTLSNNQPSVLNNLALSHAMNGDPQSAEPLLRQAVAQGSTTKKVRQNLALVLSLQGKYDEATRTATPDTSPALASADTQVIRKIVGLPPQAAPALAFETSTQVASGLKPASHDPLATTQAWSSQVAATNASQ